MTILLHICCGPCAVYPVELLRQEGIKVAGYFFNPNIHPYKEFRRRFIALEELAAREDVPVEFERDYGVREFLRQVVFHEEKRCGVCYKMRLEATVKKAVLLKADAFSTTLLYSRYQNHELICRHAEFFAEKYGVPFYYRDFRQGWQQGVDKSIEMGLYRQPYCGCIYSEQERYDNRWKKKQKQKVVSEQSRIG